MSGAASDPVVLRIDGEVERPRGLRFGDLAAIDAAHQIPDMSRIEPSRQGTAVTLEGLLMLVGVKPTARFLGLHSSTDDFHASIPLEPVLARGLLIYSLQGKPLDAKAGGPVRFFIPDLAACHSHEIDECANVKFVDHIELTRDKGYDNRPEDDTEHEALHRKEVNE